MSAAPDPLAPPAATAVDNPPRRRARRSHGWRALVALALFIGFAAWRLADHYPALPNPLALELVLEPGTPGRADPLVASGRTGSGDFLSVRFEDERTIQFVYDSWGVPGIRSAPVNIVPGRPLRLAVQLPAFDQIVGRATPGPQRARVVCDGVTVLDTDVRFYVRRPHEIRFGENPLGGTACGPMLHGELRTTSGRIMRGDATRLFTRTERIRDWVTHLPWQPVFLALACVVVAWLGDWPLRARRLASAMALLRRHRWFVGTAALCALAYAWLVTLGSFRFNHGEVFGNFYDYQAASLLQGRLDVPEDAIGGEAFEARGKLYGYFGPTPALLRMPFVAAGFAFGKLSRAFMLLYFVGCLVAAYLLLREAVRLARGATDRGHDSDPVPSPFATVSLVASTGLGSTIFFLGSRSLIFHEAILGGITFALWSCWCSLRHLRAPEGRWWLGALLTGVLSLHTRPPTGLFALTVLGCVVIVLALADRRHGVLGQRIRKLLAIAGLAFAGLLTLNGLAWLKFRTFDAAPLRISRPYTEPGRLERIEGKSFHLANIPHNFDAYVLFPNFHLERGFPWVYLVSEKPRREFPRARIDLPDHTLALPYSMPSLFGLATLGCLFAAMFRPRLRPAMAALWAAAVPMSIALFAAVATAQRYTGDFVPFLVVAAAFGLAALETLPSVARRFARAATAVATLAGVGVTAAITLHYQGAVLWGVPNDVRENYQHLRRRVDATFGVPPPGQP